MHRKHSGELDSLRCFAMLAVVALHAHLLPIGWMGVWLFYVVSGYVVTLSVIERGEDSKGVDRLSGFLHRRAIRILPVYYLYIGLGLLFALVPGIAQDKLSIAGLLFFFDNMLMITGQGRIEGWPTGHLWTLSTEMQFYALYGVVLCLLPGRWVRRILIALLLLCPLARLAVGHYFAAEGWRPLDIAFGVYAGPGLHFDIFAMGALLAFSRNAGGVADRRAYSLLLAGAGVLAGYAVLYTGINVAVRHASGLEALRDVISGILYGQYREVFLYSAVGLFMTGLVALGASGGGIFRPVLAYGPFQWIGRISYGGYLFHPLGLKCATLMLAAMGIYKNHGSNPVANVMQMAIGLSLTLVLAWLSFRWFETPCRRLFGGVPSTVRGAAGMAPVTAETS